MAETVVSAGGTKPPPTTTPLLAPSITNFTVHHHKATFTFSSSSASGFVCALVRVHKHHKHKHKPNYSSCSSPMTFKHLKPGNYIFKVKSVGANGSETTATTQTFSI